MNRQANKKMDGISPAIRVIIIFGIISMLGDVIYETARSANSQYLDLLDISATQVGLVFGIGEFLGYFLRLVAGILSDRSGRHWLFIFIGYGMVPKDNAKISVRPSTFLSSCLFFFIFWWSPSIVFLQTILGDFIE